MRKTGNGAFHDMLFSKSCVISEILVWQLKNISLIKIMTQSYRYFYENSLIHDKKIFGARDFEFRVIVIIIFGKRKSNVAIIF